MKDIIRKEKTILYTIPLNKKLYIKNLYYNFPPFTKYKLKAISLGIKMQEKINRSQPITSSITEFTFDEIGAFYIDIEKLIVGHMPITYHIVVMTTDIEYK